MDQKVEIIKSIIEFLTMAGTGFFLGFAFDVFRAIRSAVRKNHAKTYDIIVVLQDILFLLISFVFIVLVIYCTTVGELKGYYAIGMIAGFLLYYVVAAWALGRIVFWIFFVLIKSCSKILGFIKKITKIKKKDKKSTGTNEIDNI